MKRNRKYPALFLTATIVCACDGGDETPASEPTKAEAETNAKASQEGKKRGKSSKKKKGGGSGSHDPGTANVKSSDTYVLEAWADNWFAMYVGDRLVAEDSVPITTEKSFNAERVSFEAKPPFVAAFVLKDFKETDSGIEYIGEKKQQMGDGGFIAQISRQADGEKVSVTDASWRCLVIQEAPLNKDCERSSDPNTECKHRSAPEPEGWKTPDFDDSAWAQATVHSKDAVSPKHGYDGVTWDPAASLIWGPDLESDNTILCRVRVE